MYEFINIHTKFVSTARVQKIYIYAHRGKKDESDEIRDCEIF